MLFKKSREKKIEEFLKAFEAYEEAKKELRLDTGWNFEEHLKVTGYKDSENERNEMIKKYNEICNKFNTK